MNWDGYRLVTMIDRNGSATATFAHSDGTTRIITVDRNQRLPYTPVSAWGMRINLDGGGVRICPVVLGDSLGSQS